MYSEPLGTDCRFGDIHFFGNDVLGKTDSDIDTFFIGGGFMRYYRNNVNQLNIWDDSTFRIDYRTHDFSKNKTYFFYAIGKLTF